VADQPKKKPEKNKTMNTERSNRKASKQKPGDYRSPKKEWMGSHTRGTDLDDAPDGPPALRPGYGAREPASVPPPLRGSVSR
jgi:hypothetical protein